MRHKAKCEPYQNCKDWFWLLQLHDVIRAPHTQTNEHTLKLTMIACLDIRYKLFFIRLNKQSLKRCNSMQSTFYHR